MDNAEALSEILRLTKSLNEIIISHRFVYKADIKQVLVMLSNTCGIMFQSYHLERDIEGFDEFHRYRRELMLAVGKDWVENMEKSGKMKPPI